MLGTKFYFCDKIAYAARMKTGSTLCIDGDFEIIAEIIAGLHASYWVLT